MAVARPKPTDPHNPSIWWTVFGMVAVVAYAAPEFIGFAVFIGVVIAVIYAMAQSGRTQDPALRKTGRRTFAEVVAVERGRAGKTLQGQMTQALTLSLRLSVPGAPARMISVTQAVPAGATIPAVGDVLTAYVDPKRPDRFFVEVPAGSVAAGPGEGAGAEPRPAPTTRANAVSRIIETVDASGFDFAQRGADARGRIERIEPLADGAHELVLHVVPRDREAYHVRLETFVPHDEVPRLRPGASLKLRVDPNVPGRLMIAGR